MESDLWRGFVAVAEHGSFTGAADRLPISQSGLSQQLRRLESQLQVTLLERGPHGAELTDTGRQLLPLVHQLIAAEDAVLRAARQQSGRIDETMDLFVAEDATGDLLIKLIDQLRSTAPEIKVQVRQVSIEDQLNALIDAAPCAAMIERTPSPAPVGPGRRTTLRPEPLALIVPSGDGTPDVMTVAEAEALSLRSMDWLPDGWLDWFPLLRGDPDGANGSVLVVTSFRSAVQSVPLDRRPCIAPISIAETVGGGGLEVVPLIDAPKASLDLVTLSQHPLIDLLHAVAAAIGASNTDNSKADVSRAPISPVT